VLDPKAGIPEPLHQEIYFVEFRPEDHVFDHVQMRKERVTLIDDPSIAIGVRRRFAEEEELAVLRAFRSEDQPQERRFAATARPDDGAEFPRAQFEIQLIEHDFFAPELRVVVTLDDAVGLHGERGVGRRHRISAHL
jgi:hypothetical protein